MDIVDLAQIEIEREEDRRKRERYELPEGKEGECDMCGEWSGRLVEGVCAPCRDKYKL